MQLIQNTITAACATAGVKTFTGENRTTVYISLALKIYLSEKDDISKREVR